MKRWNTNGSTPPDIKKEVVAFANTAGGTIYIGMDDDGRPVGVQDPDAVVQQLTNALRDGIRPDVMMFTRISIQSMEERPVVAAGSTHFGRCLFYFV